MAAGFTQISGDAVMDDVANDFMQMLDFCFEDLENPRVQASCDHLLIDILTIAILALTCGADDWADMETFGKHRHEWLNTFLELPNGNPSLDTFRRVLGLLDRKQFSTCLFQWTQAIQEATDGILIAIDGKALRRSYSQKSGIKMLHLVTAWSSDNNLTLGQVACEEKSNEITAIPELLKMLDLKGTTVTIDAMGTQKAIASQIREQKGHYVLALKGNQSSLNSDMQKLFNEGMETDFEKMKHDYFESIETGHGRKEQRYCHVIEIPKDHPQRKIWKDLRTLVVIISRRVVDGKDSWESRSFISSHGPQAKQLAHAIRKHWSIENSQHWILDVAFGEDSRRQQDRNGSSNFAAIRRLVVSLLRQEKTLKRGAKCKRMTCALDPNYLLKVFQTTKIDA